MGKRADGSVKRATRRVAKYRCPDCDLRDNGTAGPTLNELGLPRWHPQMGYPLTLHCENCGETGRSTCEW